MTKKSIWVVGLAICASSGSHPKILANFWMRSFEGTLKKKTMAQKKIIKRSFKKVVVDVGAGQGGGVLTPMF